MNKLSNNNNKPRYVCDYPLCEKSYASKYALKHHAYVHTQLQPYRCPYCTASFVSRHMKHSHIQKEHEELHLTTPRKMGLLMNTSVDTEFRPEVGMASTEMVINSMPSTECATPFRRPLNPGQCPFCLNIFKHAFAVRVHIAKIHRERLREYFQYYSDHVTPNPKVDGNVTNTSGQLTPSFEPQFQFPIPTAVPNESGLGESNGLAAQDMFRPWFTSADTTAEDTSMSTDDLILKAIPEPIGELMLCQFCNEQFYDIKYLHWHISNEHCNSMNLDGDGEDEYLR